METLADRADANKRGQSKEWRDLKAENDALRKALEHYANRRNWTTIVDGPKLKAVFLGCENARGWEEAEVTLKKVEAGGSDRVSEAFSKMVDSADDYLQALEDRDRE